MPVALKDALVASPRRYRLPAWSLTVLSRCMAGSSTLGPLTLLLSTVLAGGCSQRPVEPPCAQVGYQVNDPAVGLNRKVFSFNQVVDTYALKPVARGYTHLPETVQLGMHNFVANFGEPKVFVNDLLQGNLRRSANTLERFVLNTTIGVVGVMDVAGRWGMPHHNADFGQTFGVWGAGSGPTVELPVFGSSSVRDGLGTVAGFLIDPLGGGDSDTYAVLDTVHTVGGIVDGRAQALPATDRMEQLPDYYQALRDHAGERRSLLVNDGKRGAVAPQPPIENCPLR